MKFKIEGVNARTGAAGGYIVTAQDEATALAKVRQLGLFPTVCKEISEPSLPTRASSVPSGPRRPALRLILCYMCKKDVAENAATCPHCAAPQTSEGRQKGRQLKTQEQFVRVAAVVFAVIICLPLFILCAGAFSGGGGRSPAPQSRQRGTNVWDKDQLERDAGEVARDPDKTILIPFDGSQPRLVPNPDPPTDLFPRYRGRK